MKRIAITPRPDWKTTAEATGFDFHTVDGKPYWDESAYYAFTLDQIERDIEAPTAEIHAMAMALVDDVVRSEELMERLAIPAEFRDMVAGSWQRAAPHVYGRIDLSYNGTGPARLLELNHQTPTGLAESSFFQWTWFEEQKARGLLPRGADQYNSIHEQLVMAFAEIAKELPRPFYFSAVRDSLEDQGTVAYMRDCAVQAGINAGLLAIEDIGLSTTGTFTDLDDIVIGGLFVLQPWEDTFGSTYAAHLHSSGTTFLEPAWKAVLSNKGILPLLWEKYRGHPNLLPAFFDNEPGKAPPPGWVRKPLFSREGANIEICQPDGSRVTSEGPYGGGRAILQAYHPLPAFDGGYPLVGSWVVGDTPCGIGMREDATLITRDSSRFVPHAIVG
jgi:glutathionylspermidine synthase